MATRHYLDYKKIKDDEDCINKEKEGRSKNRPPADDSPDKKEGSDSDDDIPF